PAGLVLRQVKARGPGLAWAREAMGARFVLAGGIAFLAQPAPALAAAGSALPRPPWRLRAVRALTPLAGPGFGPSALARGPGSRGGAMGGGVGNWGCGGRRAAARAGPAPGSRRRRGGGRVWEGITNGPPPGPTPKMGRASAVLAAAERLSATALLLLERPVGD